MKIDNYSYAAFGKIPTQTGTTVNPFTWVGQLGYYRDDETGRYTLWQREYEAQLGRLLSQDPIGFEGGDENLFRYVENNPVVVTDPSGEQPQGGNCLHLQAPLQRRIAAHGDARKYVMIESSRTAQNMRS